MDRCETRPSGGRREREEAGHASIEPERRIVLVTVWVAALIIPALPAAAADPADMSLTKIDTPAPVLAGANITYTLTVGNGGPDPAVDATLSDTTPANTTFVSLTTAAGWDCVTPAVGGTGSITCTNPSVPNGASDAFTPVVNVNAATAAGTIIGNTASVGSTTPDSDPADNSAIGPTCGPKTGWYEPGTTEGSVLRPTPDSSSASASGSRAALSSWR
jgi:uncharacterized repeat protein (TIGR01451 family)